MNFLPGFDFSVSSFSKLFDIFPFEGSQPHFPRRSFKSHVAPEINPVIAAPSTSFALPSPADLTVCLPSSLDFKHDLEISDVLPLEIENENIT
jgi:hypothetical protein